MSLSSTIWDYLTVVPAVIAIVNSVIAVGAAHFKSESQRLKIGLLVFAIVAGLGAAGATVAGQYHALHESVTGPRVQNWALMAYRLARLQQFSEELSARSR